MSGAPDVDDIRAFLGDLAAQGAPRTDPARDRGVAPIAKRLSSKMSMKFISIFGDSWKQLGTCVFANEQFAVTLVAETGTHAETGDVFSLNADA